MSFIGPQSSRVYTQFVVGRMSFIGLVTSYPSQYMMTSGSVLGDVSRQQPAARYESCSVSHVVLEIGQNDPEVKTLPVPQVAHYTLYADSHERLLGIFKMSSL